MNYDALLEQRKRKPKVWNKHSDIFLATANLLTITQTGLRLRKSRKNYSKFLLLFKKKLLKLNHSAPIVLNHSGLSVKSKVISKHVHTSALYVE